MEESLQAPVHYSQILKTNVKRISHGKDGSFKVCKAKLQHFDPEIVYKQTDLLLLTTQAGSNCRSLRQQLLKSTKSNATSVILALCIRILHSGHQKSKMHLLMSKSDAKAIICSTTDAPNKTWYAISLGSLAV